MGDSLPVKLALSELKYQIGSVPRNTVHTILIKSIKTVKEHEAWFHFGAQPLRFSIREFHMVTGLKCSGEGEGPREENERIKWDFLKGTHTVEDVENQLRHTSEDASDERLCLTILLLTKSILLQKSIDTTFPLYYVKKTHDIDVLMTYPWGRDAYELLLRSLKRDVDKNLDKKKYDLHGFPLAFPSLDTRVQLSTPIFLCEKYIDGKTSSPKEVLAIENKETLKSCKFKISDWRNMSVDLYDAHEEIRRRSLLFGNGEMGQASSSNEEESIISKINIISDMMGDNFRIMNSFLSLIGKDNKKLKVCVTELEKQQRVTSDETLHNEQSSNSFEIGANVEIASQDDTTFEYSTLFLNQKNSKKRVQQSVSSDRICPQYPPNEQRPEDTNFELIDNVEAYHNDDWCSGRVQIILTDET
ncbi:hypothetical protein N665_0366s0010 [Sinapis alba]|nr:hypothetical protein N665_0366s0010 [Sinapis alba]